MEALIDPRELTRILAKLKAPDVTFTIDREAYDLRKIARSIPARDLCEQSSDQSANVYTPIFTPCELKIQSAIDKRIPIPSLTIESGGARFTLETSDGDLPIVDPDEFEPLAVCVIDCEELRRLITQTEFACDTESTRYALGGINVEMESGKLTFCATDSRRLSVSESSQVSIVDKRNWDSAEFLESHSVDEKTDPVSGVIPVGAFRLALSMLDKTSGQIVRLAIAENECAISTGDDGETGESWRIQSRLMEGRFPKYRDVIPADSSFNVALKYDASALHDAIAQAELCSNEESRGMDLVFGETETRLQCRTDKNESDVPVASETAKLGSESVETITLTPRFVRDYVKRLTKGSSAFLALTDSESAGLMFSPDSTGAIDWRYIVMPCAPQ